MKIRLKWLQDFLVSSPQNGQIFRYVTANLRWENQDEVIRQNITSTATLTNQGFVRTSGTNVITLTLPLSTSRTNPITIKHVGTQDLTIVGSGGEQIDSAANLQLRGGKKNAVTLYPEGGGWWIA